MLSTSLLLFEGFLCVIFFMPIYYIVVTIGFIFDLTYHKSKNKLNVSIIPVLIGMMALEGISDSTSFERQNSVTREVIVDMNISQLKANMIAPIKFSRDRNWILSIFPLPVNVEAESLEIGDIHILEFVYKRWFFTNIDHGFFYLHIDQISENKVVTSVQNNTSYFSKYLKIKGTEVTFKPMSDTTTKITLSIHYNRLLDPAWYFDPLQRIVVSESANYLIDNVIVRSN